MAARQRQRNLCLALRRHQGELRTARVQTQLPRSDLGTGLHAKAQHAASLHRLALQLLLEPHAECVVGVDHRHTPGGQCGVDGALGLCDAEQAAQAFQMRGRDVVDQCHMRLRNLGEIGDIARLARAHFVDRNVRIVGRRKHRQRQADLVVAVARRGVHGGAIHAPGFGQDRQQQRLDAGLAVGAGQRKHTRGAVALHAGGDARQRQLGVVHHHLRHAQRRQQAFDQHTAGTTRHRLGGEVVPIEALAAQRHIQAAVGERAGVVADRIDHGVVAVQLAAGPMGNQRQGRELHGRTPNTVRGSSACAATRASSKACRTPATS